MTDYSKLEKDLTLISEGVEHTISVLSNAAALIYENMDDLNWCGFYLNTGEQLVLGPFQGKTACTSIDFSRGVCGKAARDDEAILVEDVHKFEGHIACDSASNSEIVIPLHLNDVLLGVLDIDSPSLSRFTEEDKAGLSRVVSSLERILSSLKENNAPFFDGEGLKTKTCAAMGDKDLCISLGNDYYYGEKHMQDPEKAVFWYKKAAELGSAEGECLLGYCFRMGIGCEKDESKAFKLFSSSASKGFAMAMYNMGLCYEKAIGTEANSELAKEWYEKAADAGYSE